MSNSKKTTPFSLRTPENGTKYKTITKRLRDNYSLEEIRDIWNDAKLGAPLKPVTVKRWLNKGPMEKNCHFEDFMMGMESALRAKSSRRVFYIEVPDNITPEQTSEFITNMKVGNATRSVP